MRSTKIITAIVPMLLAGLFTLAGCTSKDRSPEQIRQQTATATATLKRDTVAVAQGVREGLTKPKTIDLNAASRAELIELPGLTGAQADRIIAARPFDNTDQLVTRRIVTQAEFDQISERVAVKK